MASEPPRFEDHLEVPKITWKFQGHLDVPMSHESSKITCNFQGNVELPNFRNVTSMETSTFQLKLGVRLIGVSFELAP